MGTTEKKERIVLRPSMPTHVKDMKIGFMLKQTKLVFIRKWVKKKIYKNIWIWTKLKNSSVVCPRTQRYEKDYVPEQKMNKGYMSKKKKLIYHSQIKYV